MMSTIPYGTSSSNNNINNNDSTGASHSNNNDKNNSWNGGEPPISNPLQTAYEEYIQNTPYITRIISTIQMISYGMSWFIDMSNIFATTPLYVIYDYEIYRILLCTYIVNTNLISVLIGFYHFIQYGIKLERSIGSTSFLYMCFMIGIITNILFCIVCFVLYYIMSSNVDILQLSSSGLWNIIYAIISNECVHHSILYGTDYSRKFLIWDIPILYYPIVLLFMISFLSSSKSTSISILSSIISTSIGYLYGYGYFDKIMKLSSTFVRKLEHPDNHHNNNILTSLVYTLSRNDGYITSASSIGSNAWQQEETMTSASGNHRSQQQVRFRFYYYYFNICYVGTNSCISCLLFSTFSYLMQCFHMLNFRF